MKKKLIFAVVFFFFSIMVFPKQSFSIECKPYNTSNEDILKEIEKKCVEDVNSSQQKIDDLFVQIQGMDAKIYLTSIKIQQTEQKIVKTEEEIENLTSKIEGLDQSLSYLSKLLIQRIVAGYKKRDISVFSVFLDSENASDFINRFKYLRTAQNNNQKLLVQVQQAKLNYEEQKKIREQKKNELNQLKETLKEQKITLNSQKIQKQKLLSDTRNDQQQYQLILTQARRQLSAFKSFIQTSGADTIIAANGFGNGSDGSYYSQRDIRWAYKSIGYSSENILNVGCLLSSVAMVAKKYGQNVTPLDVASDFDRFYGFTAYMRLPWKGVAGRSYNPIPISSIDQELSNGNYVIVGIYRTSCGFGGDHYVVLTKKDGNDYIMHDPVYGPDIKFNSHYSSICSAATFK